LRTPPGNIAGRAIRPQLGPARWLTRLDAATVDSTGAIAAPETITVIAHDIFLHTRGMEHLADWNRYPG
jgi:hypothetical protein